MRLRDIPIALRIHIITLVALAAMLALAAIMVSDLRDHIRRDRMTRARQLVENAYSVLTHHQAEETAGRLSREAAQQAAMSAVKALRYGEGDYFWLQDANSKILMHPIKPELDGADGSNIKDPQGKRLFVEFSNTARGNGAGVVTYYWPKPGFDRPVEKISYVKGFAPWGWIVGTGVYSDDLETDIDRATWSLGGRFLVVVLILIAVASFIARSITGPLKTLTAITTKLAGGAIDTEIGTEMLDRRDEVGANARALKVFKEGLATNFKLLEHARRVKEAAQRFEMAAGAVVEVVASASTELSATAESLAQVAGQTTERAHLVAEASKTTSVSVNSIASASEQLSCSIREIGSQAEQSNAVAHTAADEAQQTTKTVQQLNEVTTRIGDIVSLIESIAAQTNMLALNATIEAARAGESGRGFAVVAQEVKALAEQTARATAEIGQQIAGIQESTRKTSVSIHSIAKTIQDISTASGAIASSVQMQGEATQEIARHAVQTSDASVKVAENIEGVQEAAEASSAAATEALTASRDLSRQADALRGEVVKLLDAIRAA